MRQHIIFPQITERRSYALDKQNEYPMKVIAHIETDFPTKFGIPRQSGLNDALEARIVFEKEYRVADAVRGLEGFSHLWLVWVFSEAVRDGWTPTVRPPRLGGNRRMGVFATRSPFRPNPIGLSCVGITRIETDRKNAPVIFISGADLMDGTPILDIKPYLPFADSRPDALGGFTDTNALRRLEVDFPPELIASVPEGKCEALLGVLESDPRPSYQSDPNRIYGFGFAGLEVRFRVEGQVLHVIDVKKA